MTDAWEAVATLHDGTTIPVQVQGAGPALLLPVRVDPHDEATATTMRRWGADPDLGRTLAEGLSSAHTVITADYEGHRMAHPAALTLTPTNLATDLLAIADAAGAARFGYYGYSWLALAGLQLAIRTDRLWALAMGGFPPIDGPYSAMLAVTRAAHAHSEASAVYAGDGPAGVESDDVEPGDWEAATVRTTPSQTQQFVTLYESLQDFDDTQAAAGLRIPRLVFAGSNDTIGYGPKWGNTTVEIAGPIAEHRHQLMAWGWQVELLAGRDHISAMHSTNVLPVLRGWLNTLPVAGER